MEKLQIAIRKNPDLIILDLIMPVIDGLETAKGLKQKTKVKEIPIIFLITGDVKTFITDAYQSGGIDYIMKPVNKNVENKSEDSKDKSEAYDIRSATYEEFSNICNKLYRNNSNFAHQKTS
jgi:PleD family two-component response regulator